MVENSKVPLSVGMIVLSGFVLLLAFGTPGGGSRPMIPSLVSVLQWPYGMLFLFLQILYCHRFCGKNSLVILFAIWAIAVPAIYLGAEFRFSSMSLAGFDRVAIGASCASGLAIGIASLKGKL